MDDSDRRLLSSVTRSLSAAIARSNAYAAHTCCEAAAIRIYQSNPAPRIPNEVWEPLLRHAATQAVRTLRYALEMAALTCESPIEELMLLALAVASASMGAPALIDEGHPSPFDEREVDSGLVTIQPQVIVGKYRVDFEVGYHLMLGPEERNERRGQGEPVEPVPGDLTWHRAVVIVECDGHDFHEETKEQASHDKRKDRDLQTAGFTIFRYSGSDVWNDCVKAAEEVVRMAYNLAAASPAVARKTPTPFR